MAAGLWWVVRSAAFEQGAATGSNGAGLERGITWTAPSENGERRRENRLEAYFPSRGVARRSGRWLRPWCLSRCKRILDITGSAAILAVLSPLMVGIAIAIKLDQPGPVFFRQWRTGLA